MSEGNKTVIAEDSDVYCDDTDVDEMQMSGSARSAIQHEHSTSLLSSSTGSSETMGREHASVTCQLEQVIHLLTETDNHFYLKFRQCFFYIMYIMYFSIFLTLDITSGPRLSVFRQHLKILLFHHSYSFDTMLSWS